MAVEIKDYCYNSSGQLCITIEHQYGVTAEAVGAIPPPTHTITVTVNGQEHTFEVTGTGEFTFCQDDTNGPIEASDDEGKTEPVEVDPPDESNQCSTDAKS